MKILSQFAESKELHDKGSKLELGNKDETVFYVRRANHKFEQAIIDCKRMKFGVYYNDSGLSVEEKMESVAEAVSEYLVAGWDNLYDEETGNKIKYSLANAKKIFCNPEMFLSLNRFIINHANDYENYLHKNLQEDKSQAKK